MKINNYKIIRTLLLTLVAGLLFSNLSFAKTPVSDDGTGEEPNPPPVQNTPSLPAKTGPGEAQKYFQKRQDPTSDQKTGQKDESIGNEHYLAIDFGGFLGSDSYQWGFTNHVSNPGRLQGGVTYRVGQVGRLADWDIRGDFIGYAFPEGNALNFSILPMILFPDATSAFPVYFGIGIGPGVFFQQIDNQSTISFNYELVGGVRFFNVIGSTGFFAETGLKNEINLLSVGQFNGIFLSLGALFVF